MTVAGNLDDRIATLADLGTDTSLDLPAGLPYDQWAEIGGTLVRVEKAIQWWLGDWWRFGELHYGEAAVAAAPTGYSADTVRAAAWVADRIEPARRVTDLSFTHHREVAALPPAEQDRLLSRARDEHWSTRDLRWRAQAAKQASESNDPPLPADFRCPECGHEWNGAPRP